MSIDKIQAKESLGFLCWKVARIVAGELNTRFAQAGIDVTTEQWRVLVPIYKYQGITQSEVCEVLSQEKTGVSRLLAALERRGLVRRETSNEDRRVRHLYITEAGQKLFDSTVDMVIEIKTKMEKPIDPEELVICKKVLWELIAPTLSPEHRCEVAK